MIKSVPAGAASSSILQQVRYAFIFLVGALIGAFVSLVVTCTLVEISISPFFGFVRHKTHTSMEIRRIGTCVCVCAVLRWIGINGVWFSWFDHTIIGLR